MNRILSTALIALCVIQVSAQELAVRKEPAFQEGEVLEYKLKYGFITAAE
ncbi:MAG: DUF3108 domain-containing protein, partial [Pedobacter sp.]